MQGILISSSVPSNSHLSHDNPIGLSNSHLSHDNPIGLSNSHLSHDNPIGLSNSHLSHDNPIALSNSHRCHQITASLSKYQHFNELRKIVVFIKPCGHFAMFSCAELGIKADKDQKLYLGRDSNIIKNNKVNINNDSKYRFLKTNKCLYFEMNLGCNLKLTV